MKPSIGPASRFILEIVMRSFDFLSLSSMVTFAKCRPSTFMLGIVNVDFVSVFAVGAGLSRHWMQTPIPAKCKIIQLTNSAYDIGKGYSVDFALLGDAKLSLKQMIKEANSEKSYIQKIGLKNPNC